MSDLIKINYENKKPTVLARDLHEFLEVGTPFRKWFPRMVEYGFDESQDYLKMDGQKCPTNNPKNPWTEITDYAMTIGMAKEIAMLQRNEKGKQVRQYFIEIEDAWNSPEQTMARALQLADKSIKLLKENVKILKPKADFYDAIVESKTAVPMATVAKTINMGIGRNKLFEFLRNKKVLQLDNTPYQSYVDRKWFRIIESKYEIHGEIKVSFKTVVFQKGIDGIRKLLLKEK